MRTRPVVAIDGPAGAGKTTVARQVAAALGYVLVDTGALYRAVALRANEEGVSWDDEDALGALAARLDLTFRDDARLYVDGRDRDDELRTPEISEGASQVSRHPRVRDALLGIQRQLGKDGGVVLEGRDIGTVVFPDAEVKVFLTATEEARAERRQRDLQARGITSDYGELLGSIRTRDRRDSERAVAPLRAATEATQLDTTRLTQPEVVDRVVGLVREFLSRTP